MHRSIQPEGIVPQPEGLMLFEKSELLSVLKQFHDSQSILLKEYQKHSAWSRRGIALGILFCLLMVAGYYYTKKLFRKAEETDLGHKIELANKETEQKLHQHIALYEENYREHIAKLLDQNQAGNQSLIEFLVRLQMQQESMQSSYEEKILTMEKEKLSLQRSGDDLRKNWTDTELELHKARQEIERLQQQISSLEKEVLNSRQEVEHWKKLASEKFSPEQWAALQQDLKKDD